MSKAHLLRRVEFFGGPKDGMYWSVGKTVVPKVRFELTDTNGQKLVHVYCAETRTFGNLLRGESTVEQRYLYRGVECGKEEAKEET